MSHRKRPPPAAVQVTPELEVLLAQFTDEEIETGVIACGGNDGVAAERHTADSLRARLADALMSEAVRDDGSKARRR